MEMDDDDESEYGGCCVIGVLVSVLLREYEGLCEWCEVVEVWVRWATETFA